MMFRANTNDFFPFVNRLDQTHGFRIGNQYTEEEHMKRTNNNPRAYAPKLDMFGQRYAPFAIFNALWSAKMVK